MNVFTIDSGNNITVHATKKAARQTGAVPFDTVEDFAEVIGADNKRLVEIWNSLTGVTPVKKFTSRDVATRRIFAEIQKLTPCTVEAPAATSTTKAAIKAKPAGRAGGKKEILLNLISRANGASLEELMAALDWQKHCEFSARLHEITPG